MNIQVGVSDWAKYGEDGQEVGNPVFPYRLRFQVLSHNLDIKRNYLAILLAQPTKSSKIIKPSDA